ncbi:MAG: ECF transporter S component [Candidatus Latescibacterota bacterium]
MAVQPARVDVGSLVRGGLLTALVAAVTLSVRIPMPATEGYINVGDAVIIAGALLYGGRQGGLAGGIGSALADLYGGYSHWVPFTLVIKGAEGWLVGGLARRLRVDLGRPQGVVLALVLAVVGTAWMVAGYLLTEWHLYSIGPALASLPGNAVQAAASIAVGVPLAIALRRTRAR